MMSSLKSTPHRFVVALEIEREGEVVAVVIVRCPARGDGGVVFLAQEAGWGPRT